MEPHPGTRHRPNRPPAGDSGGVEYQDVVPCSSFGAQVAQHGLKAWAVVVLAGLDCIGIFPDNDNAARLSQGLEFSALSVEGNVGAVFRGPQIQDSTVHHDRASLDRLGKDATTRNAGLDVSRDRIRRASAMAARSSGGVPIVRTEISLGFRPGRDIPHRVRSRLMLT